MDVTEGEALSPINHSFQKEKFCLLHFGGSAVVLWLQDKRCLQSPAVVLLLALGS